MDILNEKIKGLVTKADKSGMPYNILKKVYDRGMAAWKTGHRPGTTPQQWAFARVNSFVTKSSGTWGKADKDLADKVRGAKKEEIENPKNAKDILGQIKEARYKIGFEKGEVDMVISGRPGYLADYVQSELDMERIRAKVKSTGDEFTLEFNTNIPQRKMIKILDDKFGYTAFAEQIKEKLSKNADAGDYIDDFKKSDAPQFKGKSDKKKEKMAVAAYLDSKEEVNEILNPKLGDKVKHKFKGVMYDAEIRGIMSKSSNIELKLTSNGPSKGKVIIVHRDKIKEENIQESGHTDVASMKTQVQIAMDALQKMQMNLGKLTDEDDLPTWWTNKVATAVNKLDGMADYIDAMHDRGKEMNEENCPTCDTDPCKCENLTEGRMKELAGDIANVVMKMKKDRSMKGFADKFKKDVMKSMDIKKSLEKVLPDYIAGKDITALMNEGKRQLKDPKKETMVMKVKDANSIQVIDKRDLNKFLSKGYIQVESVEKDLDEGKYTLPITHVIVDTRTNKVTKAASDDKSLKLDVGRKSHLKIVKLKKPTTQKKTGYLLGEPLKAWGEEVELDEQKVFVFRYEYKGKRYAAPFKSEKDAKDAMKAAMTDKNVKNASMTQDILKRGVKFAEDVEIVEFIDEAVLAGRDYNYDGKSPIKISKKMYAKVQRDSKSMIKGKPYMMALNPKTQGTELVPVVFEEVDNSLAAQASRVISQTAIREKKDPADIDVTATDLDRKAADKNIFVQLKRAQDMRGKGDIEFLDKKKKKVDIKIINKAIDMMMKMKPADRAKMQTAIGKSYRDLLKTVQRGKV